MNTSPGDADNPTGVFVPPHGSRVCAAAQWPHDQREAETNGRPPGAGLPAGSTLPAGPAITPSAAAGTERRSGGKSRKSCWRRAGRGLLTVLARIWAGSRRGRGMDSVTRGSGIALSVLVAATASILLLLPGKPAGSWRGPGASGQVVMASAVATSLAHARTWIAALRQQPAGGQPAAGPARCRAAGPRSGRSRAGLARPGVARPGSCRRPGAHRHQHMSRRLSRYRGIRPDLP